MTTSSAREIPKVAPVVARNIRSRLASQRQTEANRGPQEKAADVLTLFSGTMVFAYIHAAWFAIWMMFNAGVGGLPAFDPFPFGLLTMIVSLEAIFLSTFVLISQNRSAALADRRADLDLQTNLLAEYEITRILRLTKAISDHLGLRIDSDEAELLELAKDLGPEGIADVMRQREPRGP